MKMDTPVIDFCICTYNREDMLRRCLDALLPQLNDRTVITIVDNKSTDGTVALIKSYRQQHAFIRYQYEASPGLSRARNTGWRTSNAEWIFYLDDDCIADAQLVSVALALVDSHPEYAAFGGPIYPAYLETPPDWFPASFGSFEIKTDQLKELQREYIRGGNMMIMRIALADTGGFDEALGVKGNLLRYGEEIALQHALRSKGYRIAYEPKLVMRHWVRPEKYSLRWLLQSEYARRRDKQRIESEGPGRTTFRLLGTLANRIIYVPYFLGQALFDKKYHGKSALLDSLQPVAYRLGEWVGSIKRLLQT